MGDEKRRQLLPEILSIEPPPSFFCRTYYEMGVGTVADYAKALEYYGKAASKGYSPAAEKLNLPVAMGAANPLKKNENKHNIVDLQHFEPPGADCKIM